MTSPEGCPNWILFERSRPLAREKSLPQLRKDIDAVDRKILDLLARRGRLAAAVGEAKRRGARKVLDVGREQEVLAALRKANPGPLSGEAVEAVFREIISACRASQQPTTVAYLGPEGTFSHAAAIKQFGHGADFQSVATIAEVFTAVESGRCSFGVVPVENTTEGAVTPTLDALAETTTEILGELLVRVEHCVLGKKGVRKRVSSIASHPQVLAQCRRFLADKYPGVATVPESSSAAAARLAAGRKSVLAIGTRLAAELYDLEIVAESIQDNANNVTRFLVLGSDAHTQPTGHDRTSVVVTVKDEVGVLERIIRQFSRNKVNLSMIESRPILGRRWEYRFFVDVTGHRDDEAVARALRSVERIALSVKVLGSYPVEGES
jgi:chorismate mutase/prephenate dehydratase